MKQKDILLIVVIVIVSAVLSFVGATFLLGSPQKHLQRAEVVTPISSDFQEPSQKYFNSNSIDPTQLIQIGDNNNPTPFQ
jgi:flagellar basal body-associated protein FliL